MSARMGSCSWESSWGSASGLADCGERISHEPDGVCGNHSPRPRTGRPTPLGTETFLLATRNAPISIPHPCSTASCTGLWWSSAKQKLSAQLSCTSGKGDAKPYQLACTYLTQDIHGQVHQPKNIPLVPWVQHADVVGDVVGAALHPGQGGIL